MSTTVLPFHGACTAGRVLHEFPHVMFQGHVSSAGGGGSRAGPGYFPTGGLEDAGLVVPLSLPHGT